MRRIAVVTLLLWSVASEPAIASCVSPAPLRERVAEARVAFVGTVTGTTNRGRDASVDVESIWLGPRLPETVEVSGGPSEANAISSVDRSWETGERYLFVLDDPAPPFRDDACSATTPYTPAVAELEPEGAIAPEESTLGAWLVVGLALLALGALQARRAWRRARSVNV